MCYTRLCKKIAKIESRASIANYIRNLAMEQQVEIRERCYRWMPIF